MRTRPLLLIVFVLLALGVGLAARPALDRLLGPRAALDTGTSAAAHYQCSMHPRIVADAPGVCPICSMPLTRITDEHGLAPAAPGTPLFYRNPMRADVTSPVPAKDEMGMDYIAVYAEDLSGEASDVPGHAGFTLSSQRQQLIGVRRATAERRSLARDIRAVGTVAYDPALYQAMSDYRQALAGRGRLNNDALIEARDGSDAIARAAALRLRQLGLSDAQVRDAGRGGGNPSALLLPGATAWIYAQVYEYEIDAVRAGQAVTVSMPSQPGLTYQGRVAGIDPILDSATRTARVRVQVSTPDGGLRPASFVTALIHVPTSEVLAVPSDAVLDTGEHQYVFAIDGTAFTPRTVHLGREAGGWTEVLDGLSPGTQVVTGANFLIDSESRFRAALAAFRAEATADSDPATSATNVPHPDAHPAGAGR
ncbi:MAG: efflux RND transporter periplasmic adaptor subunit [bacterium]